MRIIVEFDSNDVEQALAASVGLELYDGVYEPDLQIIDVQKVADGRWAIKADMRCPDTPDWPRKPRKESEDA